MTVATTAATRTGLKLARLISPRTTSREKSVPARGALKVAAMPAAVPQPTRSLTPRWLILMNRPAVEPIAAPIWTMGPSRPALPPLPMEMALASALSKIVRGLMRPPRSTALSMTSGTPSPLASLGKKRTRGPMSKPPRATTRGRSRSDSPPVMPSRPLSSTRKNQEVSRSRAMKPTVARPAASPTRAA